MKKKLFIYFSIVFIIGMVASTLLSFSVIKRETDIATRQHMITDVGLLKKIVELEDINKLVGEAFTSFTELKDLTKARITIIDETGTVLNDSEADYRTMGNHGDRPEVITALAGEIGINARYSSTLGSDFLYVAERTKTQDGEYIIVRLSMPLTNIKEIITKTEKELVLAFFFGLILSLLMGYSVAVFLSKPLKKITVTAKNIADGDFTERLYYNGNDEIRNLTGAFNNMTEKLGVTMGALKTQNSNMSSILDNVMNGIIAVDSEERVLFMNRSAADYIGVDEPVASIEAGQYAIKALRDNRLDEFIKFLIADKELCIEEMKFARNNEMDFLLYGNPMFPEGGTEPYGYIIVIHDITEIKRLERVRTDFVANVSHELKTPLTSIKGFAETLRNGGIDDPATTNNFLEIILEESVRLQTLIDDILSLSEIESKRMGYEEEFNVKHAIEEVVQMLLTQAESKNQQLELHIKELEGFLFGNRNKFKQMLINLIENAIKYTEEKGTIRVESWKGETDLEIRIKDTGIGIPEESLGRIFERFYRVDKARSREMGGTGLGLSIVKHIVQTYQGKIEVTSTLGEGTEFRIRIPMHIELNK